MEFLEIEKQPIPKDDVLKISNIISKIDPLTKQNTEKLKDFLDFIWNKKSKKSKVEEQQTYTIKNAIKTNIQINLIQYTMKN